MTLDPFTLAGIAGTALIIVAYFGNSRLAQERRLAFRYQSARVVMIMLSLVTGGTFRWPWSRVLAAISVYGLIKSAGLWKRG
jgi:hypothetical protein